MGSIGLGKSDVEARLAQQDWEDISRRLTAYAHGRLRKTSRELAEELAQTAIERVLSKQYAPWDPERYPRLLDYLGTIVNTLVYNHWQSLATKAERGKMRDAEQVEEVDDSPEEKLTRKDLAARAAQIVKRRVRERDDALCVKLIELMSQGIERPQELSASCNVDVEEIYLAKRRLGEHAAAAKRELDWEDDDGQ